MHVPRIAPAKLALTAGLLTLALAVPLTAAADTYDYSFSEISTNVNIGDAAFTYVSPVLITTDTTFTPLTCSTTVLSFGTCTSIEIDPDANAGNPQLTMDSATDFLSFMGFPASFFQVGDNSADSGDFIMDITDVSDVSTVTPEPASFILLATGLLALFGVLRWRPTRAMMEG